MPFATRVGAALLVGTVVGFLGEQGAFDQAPVLTKDETVRQEQELYNAKGRRMIHVRANDHSLLDLSTEASKCKGTLVIPDEVYNVKDDGDWFSKNDLYLQITGSAGNQKKTYKSHVFKEAGSKMNLKGQFCFQFDVQRLDFKVMDDDLINDDLLVTFAMDHTQIQEAASKKEVLVLDGKNEKGKVEGNMRVEVRNPKKASAPDTESGSDTKSKSVENKGNVPDIIVTKPNGDVVKPLESDAPAQEPVQESNEKKPFFWNCPGANDKEKFDRIRKDYNDLTEEERQLYIKAVQTAKERGIYDIFVTLHKFGVNDKYAHQTNGFFPWHRKFLLEYENMLRGLDKEFECIGLPFWNWAQESKVCQLINQGLDSEHEDDNKARGKKTTCESYEDVGSIIKDFGGKGNPMKPLRDSGFRRAFCVTSGPFSDKVMWKDFEDRQCLSRGTDWHTRTTCQDSRGQPMACAQSFSGGAMVGRVALTQIMKRSVNHAQFMRDMYGVPHGSPHVKIGGHMGAMWSPQDPLFFSHHAFIDKLWWNHQDCHDEGADKKDVMWMKDRSTHSDQELPFCFPFNMLRMSWAQRNAASGGSLAKAIRTSNSVSEWCKKTDGTMQMSSAALSSWTNSYKLSDYIDSMDLPGDGNNVMYWPDDYDRHVAAANVDLCTTTKVQVETQKQSSDALNLLEVSSSAERRAVLEHHANMMLPGKGWGKIKQNFKKKLRSKQTAIDNLNMVRDATLRRVTKLAVARDLATFKEKGLDATVVSECKDMNSWETMVEISEPAEFFKAWYTPEKRAKAEQRCVDEPTKCEYLSPCKQFFLKNQRPENDVCKDLKKPECIKKKPCAWINNPSTEGSDGVCL